LTWVLIIISLNFNHTVMRCSSVKHEQAFKVVLQITIDLIWNHDLIIFFFFILTYQISYCTFWLVNEVDVILTINYYLVNYIKCMPTYYKLNDYIFWGRRLFLRNMNDVFLKVYTYIIFLISFFGPILI